MNDPVAPVPAVTDDVAIHHSSRSVRWQNVVSMLWVGDVIVTMVSTELTVLIWSALPTDFTPTPFMAQWLVGSVVVWSAALSLLDGYDIVAPTFWRSSLGVVSRALIVVLLVTAMVFFTVPFLFPRGVGALAPFVASIALVIWRLAFARGARSLRLRRRVAFLGIDEASRRTAEVLRASRTGVSYDPVVFLTRAEDAPLEIEGLRVRRDTERLWDVVRELDVDEIVVGTDPAIVDVGRMALVECFARGVTATPAVALYEALTGRVLVASLGATWFAQIPTEPHRPYLLAKRAIDILVVLTVSPIMVPLAVVLAIVVWLGSGRPILYRQLRLGERRTPFVIHKFRTMTLTAEPEGARYAATADPRRTRIGLVLRRSHLDELPQLWDILRGHMSLIGPRPERPEFVDRIREAMPLYEARFLLKPGLTGWAQVRLPYSANLEESLMKLEYDLYYVKHVGPILDLAIVLRTLGTLLRFSGR